MDESVALSVLQRGISNTPVEGEIRNRGWTYRIVRSGVDEVRFTLALAGDVARYAEDLTRDGYRPRGMPGCFFLGRWVPDGFGKRFDHYTPDLTFKPFLHVASKTLHVPCHPEGLLSVSGFPSYVSSVVGVLAGVGLSSSFAPRLARVDVTADVLFSSPAYYRRCHEALRGSIPSHGRVVSPYRESLYLMAGQGQGSKRLARWYDKGRQLVASGIWDSFPNEHLGRLEAEQVWESASRPGIDAVTREWAQAVFRDRFSYVGSGTLSWNGGLMDHLLSLLARNEITPAKYERLYTFLEHERVGLAGQLYGPIKRLQRAREARALGLEVPALEGRSDADIEYELDVRSMIDEAALSL